MIERPDRALACLAAVAAVGFALPVAALSLIGIAAWWHAAIAVAGVIGACYALADAGASAPPVALLAAALLLASAGSACFSVARQWRKTRQALAPFRSSEPACERLRQACAFAGVDPTRVRQVPAPAVMGFCHGLRSPRITVSSAMVDALDDDELAAVLAHEHGHLRRWDPLRMLFARSVAAGAFWLPVTRDLRDRYLLANELAADRAAIERVGERALARVLLRVAEPAPAGVVGFATDAFDRRVDALLGVAPEPLALCRRRVAVTVVALVAAGGLVAWAALVSYQAPGTFPGPAGLGMTRAGGIHGPLGMIALAFLNTSAAFVIARVAGRLLRRWH